MKSQLFSYVLYAPIENSLGNGEDFLCPLHRIDVWILFVEDEDVGGFYLELRQVSVEVQLGENRDVRAYAFTNTGKQIAFGVRVTLSNPQTESIEC